MLLNRFPAWLKLGSYALCLTSFFSATAALVIGAWFVAQSDRKEVIALTQSSILERTAQYFIVLSVLTAIFTFVFLIGVLNNSIPLIGLYAIVNGFFLVISCGFLISISVYLNLTKNYLEDLLQLSIRESYHSPLSDSGHSKAWNFAQVNFGCCGVESIADWRESDWYKGPNNVLTIYGMEFNAEFPFSCCFHENEKEWRNIDDPGLAACYAPQPSNYIATRGCLEPLSDFIHDNIYLLFGYLMYMFWVAMVGQVLAVLFSCVVWDEKR